MRSRCCRPSNVWANAHGKPRIPRAPMSTERRSCSPQLLRPLPCPLLLAQSLTHLFLSQRAAAEASLLLQDIHQGTVLSECFKYHAVSLDSRANKCYSYSHPASAGLVHLATHATDLYFPERLLSMDKATEDVQEQAACAVLCKSMAVNFLVQ